MNISEIKSRYNPHADDEAFILKRIFRPVSFYLTWFYIRMGIRNANWINLIGLVNGLLALALIAFGWWRIGVPLYLLYMINDQCDGNLARAMGTTSYRGKFMDGAIDVLIDGFLPLALLQSLFGAILSMLFIYSMFLLNRWSFFDLWLQDGNRVVRHRNPLNDDFLRRVRNFEINCRIACLLFGAFLVESLVYSWMIIFLAWTVVLMLGLYRMSDRFDVHKQSRMGR